MAPASSTRPFLSVVIPAYNEGRRLQPALRQLRDYFARVEMTAEVIIVDDGSSDETAALAEAFQPGPMQLVLLRNRINRGKGYSVRRGMRRARGEVLLMSDADQSTPIWQIEAFLPLLAEGFDIVIGSRDMADSDITQHQTIPRRVLGHLLRRMRRLLMLPDIRDTQCGFKAFTRRAAKEIFPRVRTDRFAFDCEVLLLARKLGYRIAEIGVAWCNDPDSRVRPFRDPVEMLISLVRIWWRHRHVRPPARRSGPPR